MHEHGKQFNRLYIEHLKAYYVKNFEVYKELSVIMLDISENSQGYVISLHDRLNDTIKGLKVISREVSEVALDKVFNERHELRTVSKKLRGEQLKNIDVQNARQRAYLLELKLNMVEEDLNAQGIDIALEKGEIVFSESYKIANKGK